uniref:Uncharacterized protein n=1 Tax=Steinernema glaseri TaxID=37863 RepID=A0A1I7Z3T5_9BILA
MGNVMSAFGFNQPFLFALLGIVIVLSLTVISVADCKPGEDEIQYQDVEWNRPRITIDSPFLNPQRMERQKKA